jgi:predicted transcriptional regulator
MSIEAQKIRLIERIAQVENQNVIDQINNILEQNENDFYHELTDEQQASAQRGLSQVQSGDTVPHAEVKKIYKKWL